MPSVAPVKKFCRSCDAKRVTPTAPMKQAYVKCQYNTPTVNVCYKVTYLNISSPKSKDHRPDTHALHPITNHKFV